MAARDGSLVLEGLRVPNYRISRHNARGGQSLFTGMTHVIF